MTSVNASATGRVAKASIQDNQQPDKQYIRLADTKDFQLKKGGRKFNGKSVETALNNMLSSKKTTVQDKAQSFMDAAGIISHEIDTHQGPQTALFLDIEKLRKVKPEATAEQPVDSVTTSSPQTNKKPSSRAKAPLAPPSNKGGMSLRP